MLIPVLGGVWATIAPSALFKKEWARRPRTDEHPTLKNREANYSCTGRPDVSAWPPKSCGALMGTIFENSKFCFMIFLLFNQLVSQKNDQLVARWSFWVK